MARNAFPGVCYVCGAYCPTGYGHFERNHKSQGPKWRIKCVKCASGRIVRDTDPEVIKARRKTEC